MRFLSVLLPSLLAAAVAVAGVASTSAQIIEEEGSSLRPGGTASFPLTLTTTLDGVAGIQGVVYFEPARVELVELSPGPGQPDSFVLRCHEIEPGKMQFLVYSPQDTFSKDNPVVLFNVTAPDIAGDAPGDSALVLDLTYVSATDGQLHAPNQPHINYPIRIQEQPGISEVTGWSLR